MRIHPDPETGDFVKGCSGCKRELPLDHFSKQGPRLRNLCKTCACADTKARYAKDPESWRERSREWAIKNPEKVKARRAREMVEQHDKLLARWRESHAKRKDQERAQRKIRYANETPEERKALRVKYRATFIRLANERRARLKGAAIIEKIDREAIIARDASTCYLCQHVLERNEVTLDHVIPLIRGGAHAAFNLRVACRPCNSRKHAHLL